MFDHAMVDLETMGNGSFAAIASIGIYLFDLNEKSADLPDPRKALDANRMFYRLVDLGSCQRRGLQVETDTIYWWMKQNDPARRALTAEGKVSIEQALQEAFPMLQGKKVWGHGAGFDPVILGNAYKVICGVPAPWKYADVRDTRTLYDVFFGGKPPCMASSAAHHALVDAYDQTVGALACFEELRHCVAAWKKELAAANVVA
jgi:hypothetical protein